MRKTLQMGNQVQPTARISEKMYTRNLENQLVTEKLRDQQRPHKDEKERAKTTNN